MQPPSQEKISRLVQHRQVLVTDQKAALIREKAQKAEVARIELDITQFKELHHPTTYDAVIQARKKRDSSWQAIKAGKGSLQQGAESFEATIIHADKVADMPLDDVEEATKLQNLVHQLEREKQVLLTLETQYLNLKEEIQLFDGQWAEQALGLGLIAMPLEDIGGWIIKREKALAAAAIYQDTQNDHDSLKDGLTPYSKSGY